MEKRYRLRLLVREICNQSVALGHTKNQRRWFLKFLFHRPNFYTVKNWYFKERHVEPNIVSFCLKAWDITPEEFMKSPIERFFTLAEVD